MLFYEILQSIMDEKELNIPDVARLSGLPDSTVRSIITRKNKSVALEVAFKISKGLDVPIERLNGEDVTSIPTNCGKKNADITLEEQKHMDNYRNLDSYGRDIVDSVLDLELKRLEDFRRQMNQPKHQNSTSSHPKVKLPLFTLPASAGRGVTLDNDVDFETISVEDKFASREASFAVRVSGDSMEPEYHNGDVLLVKNDASVDEGDLGIFVLNGEGYFKELGRNCLISHNDKYDDIIITADDSFYVKGRVLGKA